MVEKNADGYIIGDFPATAKTLDGYKYLIAISEGALSEYSKDGFNRVLYYFQKKLGYKVDIDNLNHEEWKASIGAKKIVEIKNRANISYEEKDAAFAEDFINKFSADVPESSSEDFKRELNNTLLSVCIENNGSWIHVELPYCTIEKLCDSIGEVKIN